MIFILLVVVGGCEKDSSSKRKNVPDIILVVEELAKNLTEEQGFYLEAISGRHFDDIENVYFDFTVEAKCNVSQVRKLYITVMDKILNRINSDKQLRPFLHEYPVTHEFVNLHLNFEEKGRPVPEEYVYMVSVANGTIFYTARNSIGGGRFVDLHKEPFKEAWDIVMKNKGKHL